MKTKSRMKRYRVKMVIGHESFNGYDHLSPWATTVYALNESSAYKKAAKLVPFGHWIHTSLAEVAK